MTTCACSRPAGDANLCGVCGNQLEQALAETPWLIGELETVMTRQAVYAGRSDGSRSSIKPLPFHVAAAETKRTIEHVLEVWSKRLITTTCPMSRRPAHTSIFLLRQVNTIRHHARAQEIHDDILTPIEKARWLIDRPPDRWYAGPCDNQAQDGTHCGTELYAVMGSGTVTCRNCEAEYDTAVRREWLLQEAEDHIANAATIARAVTWLGQEPVSPRLIRVWADRKRLIAKGHEPYPSGTDPNRTRPLYRVGDVIDLLAEGNRRKTEGKKS